MKKNKLEEEDMPVKKKRTEECDLRFLTNLLLQVHKKYYEEGVEDVRDILQEKKNVFINKKFYVEENDPVIKKLIKMHGGFIVEHPRECDVYLRSKWAHLQPYEEGSIPIVHTGYIYNSIYKLEVLPFTKFLLGSFECPESDSETDTIESLINDIEEGL